MNARIGREDMKHLQTFSDAHKTQVMEKIMSCPPEKTVVLEGNNDFEKALLRLRRDGFGLIDLQWQMDRRGDRIDFHKADRERVSRNAFAGPQLNCFAGRPC